MRETRVQREASHRATVSRQPAVPVQRAELEQQPPRLGVGRCRGQVEPAELGGIADAGGRELEGESREISLEDLGGRAREKLVVFVGRPEPEAETGSQPPGSASALIGGGAGHPHRG